MAAAKINGHDPKRITECVERIEAELDKLESLRGSYMADCKVHREDIAEIYEEAKSAWGIPKKTLKAVVKTREAERKAKKLRDSLDLLEQDTFDQIRLALGDLADTPLGRAATGEAPEAEAGHNGGISLDEAEKAFKKNNAKAQRRKPDPAMDEIAGTTAH